MKHRNGHSFRECPFCFLPDERCSAIGSGPTKPTVCYADDAAIDLSPGRLGDPVTVVRIGVIGCGELAQVGHIPNLLRIQGAKITALCDSDPVACRAASALAPSAAIFADAGDLIGSGSADALIISLPSHVHADAAVAGFRAGVHIYLEKPIASRLDDARRIVDAWRESDRVGMIGHSYRFNPLVRRLRHLIASGSIGAVTSVRTTYVTPAPPSGSWRRSQASGGGALLDLGVHHVDLLRFVLDCDVESVSAQIESSFSDHDFAILKVWTTTSVAAEINVSFGTGFRDRVEFYGETGVLWIDRAHAVDVGQSPTPGKIGMLSKIGAVLPSRARLAYRASRRRSTFHEPSFALAMAAFIQAAATGMATKPDLDDGLASLAVVDAAERSSALGKPVQVFRPGPPGGGVVHPMVT